METKEEEEFNDPFNEWIEEEATKVKCEKCGFEGLKDDCETTQEDITTADGSYLLIITYLCPKCGGKIEMDDYTGDLGVGPNYGDYDPDHVGWDSGDYGDYGEGGE